MLWKYILLANCSVKVRWRFSTGAHSIRLSFVYTWTSFRCTRGGERDDTLTVGGGDSRRQRCWRRPRRRRRYNPRAPRTNDLPPARGPEWRPRVRPVCTCRHAFVVSSRTRTPTAAHTPRCAHPVFPCALIARAECERCLHTLRLGRRDIHPRLSEIVSPLGEYNKLLLTLLLYIINVYLIIRRV